MEYEVAVNNTRILAIANASIQDNFTTERVVRYLKMRNAWSSLAEMWLPCSGLKIGGNPVTASNIYGINGVHDLTQATGAAQPLYIANALTFDGSDDTLIKSGISKAQILSLTNGGDFTYQWVGNLPQLSAGTPNVLQLVSYSSSNSFRFRAIGVAGNKLRLQMVLGASSAVVTASSALDFGYSPSTVLQITIQYVASTGVATFFVNEVSLGNGDNALPNVNNLADNSYTMSLANLTTNYYISTYRGSAFFNNASLTPQQCRLEV